MANEIASARAYDVAKELNLSSKELKQFVLDENLGFTITSHMAILTGDQITAIRTALGLDEDGNPIEAKKATKPKRTRGKNAASDPAEETPAGTKNESKPKRTRSRKANADAPAATEDATAKATPSSKSRSKKADDAPAADAAKEAKPKRSRARNAAPKPAAPPAEPMRVHELAKELGMKSGELRDEIANASLGWEASSHLTRLTAEQVGQVRAALSGAATAEAEKAPAKKAPAKEAAAQTEDKPKSSRKRSRKSKSDGSDKQAEAAVPAEDDKKAPTQHAAETKVAERTAAPIVVENPVDDVAEQAFSVGRDYLKTAFADLGFGRVTVRPSLSGDFVEFNVGGYQLEEVLGSTGAGASTELLDSLEELAARAISTQTGRRYGVKIDLGGFREKRQSMLADAAARVGSFVKESGKTLVFAVMNAIDRRAMHSAFSDDETIETDSFGDGPLRRMAVRKR